MHDEIAFQVTMHLAKKLLEQGVITPEEYVEFDTKMKEKYAPIIGDLFSDISLL